MRALLDPTGREVIIPLADATLAAVYSQDDEVFIRNAFARYLRHDFGYGYIAPAAVPALESAGAAE
jgi:hypothetical protein